MNLFYKNNTLNDCGDPDLKASALLLATPSAIIGAERDKLQRLFTDSIVLLEYAKVLSPDLKQSPSNFAAVQGTIAEQLVVSSFDNPALHGVCVQFLVIGRLLGKFETDDVVVDLREQYSNSFKRYDCVLKQYTYSSSFVSESESESESGQCVIS